LVRGLGSGISGCNLSPNSLVIPVHPLEQIHAPAGPVSRPGTAQRPNLEKDEVIIGGWNLDVHCTAGSGSRAERFEIGVSIDEEGPEPAEYSPRSYLTARSSHPANRTKLCS